MKKREGHRVSGSDDTSRSTVAWDRKGEVKTIKTVYLFDPLTVERSQSTT